MIEIRFSGPDRCEKVVIPVKLMEPGTIYVVHDFLIQILHELRVFVRVFLASGHMIKCGGSVDRFRESPVHAVMDDRLPVPIRRIYYAGCSVCIPSVRDRAVKEILCGLYIFSALALSSPKVDSAHCVIRRAHSMPWPGVAP